MPSAQNALQSHRFPVVADELRARLKRETSAYTRHHFNFISGRVMSREQPLLHLIDQEKAFLRHDEIQLFAEDFSPALFSAVT